MRDIPYPYLVLVSCLGSTNEKNSKDTFASKRSLRSDVGSLDVLVAEAFDFVLSLFLIEADLGRSHDLTGALVGGVELHLKKAERVVPTAPVVIKLHKRHGTSSNNRDDRVCSM